jgi:hypothetical protein
MCDDVKTNTLPEFKPGNTPYLKFGNEILNDNMPWRDMLDELLAKSDLTPSAIASFLDTTVSNLDDVINGNGCPLAFKQGAALVSLWRQCHHEHRKEHS